MKKFNYFLISLILSLSVSYGQISWNQQLSGTYENLNAVYMVDLYTHYVAGNNGTVLKTTNSGQQWVIKSLPTSAHLYCVYFENASTGFFGAQNATIYKTTDGGNTWEANGGSSTYAITSVMMPSTNAGYCGDHYGNIQKSTDNGQTWNTLTTMPGYDSKIFFLNENRGWAVDTYGYVYSTSNSGYNWTSVRISTDTLSSVYFLSSSIGYIAGDSGRVFKTTNGGTNWTLLTTNSTAKLKSIYVENLNVVYACGSGGAIINTSNGGTSWYIGSVSTNNYNDFNFIPGSLIGCMVGDLGKIYRTFNMGNSCVASSQTSTGYPFYSSYSDSRTDILFLANELIASGVTTGIILQIGFTYNSTDTITMHELNVKLQNTALSTLTGFVSSGWTVVHNSDYTPRGTGLRFINLNYPQFSWNGTSNLLMEICFNNSVTSGNSIIQSSSVPGMTYHAHSNLATGSGCTDITSGSLQSYRPNVCFVVQTVNGVNNGNNNVPNNYSLSQNYPNPFNPVTKIKFGIPKLDFVTLKIYDVLGKEVKTLISDEIIAGEYIIDFDASDMPSGTYFYKLETGNFTDTKKLILLK